MKSPYAISSKIVKYVASISEKIGEVNAAHLNKPKTNLRKSNRIKTIQASLEIEGNTLTVEQITALLNNKRVLAPEKDILEVTNAIAVYDKINQLNPVSIRDFKSAHKMLMSKLVKDAGKFRTTEVGILKGSKVAHLAPPGHLVDSLMKALFEYIKNDREILLIKSCVFHYELEFIHPFIDGNGRMGRLWQTALLIQQYPVFEYLPIETIIRAQQVEYYNALSKSDKSGNSTPFILFMLNVIDLSLDQLLKTQRVNLTELERIQIFKETIGIQQFSRQDYLRQYKEISPATASRDLKKAVERKIITKYGDKRMTRYKFNKAQ